MGRTDGRATGCLVLVFMFMGLFLLGLCLLGAAGEGWLDGARGRVSVYSSPAGAPGLIAAEQPFAANGAQIEALAEMCPEADGACISRVIAAGGDLFKGIGEGAESAANAAQTRALTPQEVEMLREQVRALRIANNEKTFDFYKGVFSTVVPAVALVLAIALLFSLIRKR